ncbi:hypothetical protein LTR84_004604 [Exophiala bonariae]|uniref:F-box domain-containing protein n=1 Tax=Exophiala bonariae TaxID=1690606 RepID=A0AAV9NMD1_9EURO|nr:hypothetical protein LTR84_004604 [Exophiala bonariae]
MYIEDDYLDNSPPLPVSLLDLLSNSLVLDHIVPYLPLSSIFALVRSSRVFRDLLLKTPSVFRSVDLSKCSGAYVPPDLLTGIDSGGHSWRAERIDENLTEDEFYAGPLRGVFWNLRRMHVLQSVQILILDNLASVTSDLISDIVFTPEYNIRILSIRRCGNVNQAKLQQLLRHLCRPSRPEGTPRLQGLYYFSQPASTGNHLLNDTTASSGVTFLDGAQLGTIPCAKPLSNSAITDPWYSPTGKVIDKGFGKRSSWEETLQACYGVISFDAVLCTHMHTDMAPVLHAASQDYLQEHKAGIAPMATISLGPDGCAGCGRHPQGAPVWGESDISEFPLLWPPPTNAKLIDAVRPPPRFSENGKQLKQRLIVACSWCLTNRHCESCHRWWCADCYNPKKSKKWSDMERLSTLGLSYLPSLDELRNGAGNDDYEEHIKVFNGLCVQNCLVAEYMAGAGEGGMWG